MRERSAHESSRHVSGAAVYPRHLVGIVLAVVLLAGLLARSYQLTARSLWFDESFCWGAIRFPWAEMVRRVGMDNHPPLYFLLLKSWTLVLGESLLAMRGLSVLLGLLTVLVVYLFVAEAFVGHRSSVPNGLIPLGQRAGLIAAALIALGTFQVRWSQEIRMYVLAACLTAVSSWLMFRAIHAPRVYRRWILFGVSSLALAYTHYYGLLSAAAQFVFLAAFLVVGAWSSRHREAQNARSARAKRLPVSGVLVAGAIVVIGYLPWIPTLLAQRAQVQSDFWTHPMTAWSIPKALDRVCLLVPFGSDRFGAIVTTVGCLVVLGLLLRRAKSPEWYLVTAVVVPLAAAALITQYDTRVFTARYLFSVHLLLMAGAAVLIARIRPREVRWLVITVLMLVAIDGNLSRHMRLEVAHRPGGRAAVAFLESRRRPGEPVVVCSPLLYFSLLYYARDRNAWYLYDHPDYPMTHFRGKPIVEARQVLSREQLEQIESRRIWVADMHSG
ncbi:MAG: glycosyltransferase family 39 protein, partial [Pirellulales bacterium]|nr:glycosyltransferase family 39 protein [Pirellulales bacterium]